MACLISSTLFPESIAFDAWINPHRTTRAMVPSNFRKKSAQGNLCAQSVKLLACFEVSAVMRRGLKLVHFPGGVRKEL